MISKRALVLLGLAACKRNPQFCEDVPNNLCQETSSDSSAIDTPQLVDAAEPDVPDGNPDYMAIAVAFQKAGNDYLHTDMLEGTQNGPRGIYSVWLKFTGPDNTENFMQGAQVLGVSGGAYRTQSGKLRLWLPNCAAVTLLDMTTTTTYTAASGWIHVLASWDVSAGRAQLYVDNVDVREPNPTTNNGDICYRANLWGIGGLDSGKLDAEVAEVYGMLDTSLDISDEQVRRRFRNVNGKPADLGPDCRGPTGTQPNICLRGPVAAWNVNQGKGGGFTVGGNGLTAATTSPSN